MIVVADTGPILYLFLIGEAGVLQAVYGEVAIPEAVARELGNTATPEALRVWLSAGVPWLHIHRAEGVLPVDRMLDDGEREAIVLANQLKASYLLMDDDAGRRAARRYATATVTGTIGVLYAASVTSQGRSNESSLDYFERCIRALRNTSFYFSTNLDQTIELLKNRLRKPKE